MKENILKLLKNTNNYLSGEDISTTLGISRTAVWKHIKNLKIDGHNIIGISKKGYKLIEISNTVNLIEVKNNLQTNFIGKNFIFLKETSSTNTYAKDLCQNDIEDGTVVLALRQSNGKGRLNRDWISPSGGLWFSIILKPNLNPQFASKITIIIAAAIIKTLNKYNLDVKVKWPNDIIVNNKKVCGVLAQMNCEMERINHIILGVGINVNINNIDHSLQKKATSLSIELKEELNESQLLCSLLKNFEELYEELLSTLDFKSSLAICRENSWLLGKEVLIQSQFEEFVATAYDIDLDGQLIVKTNNGELKTVYSGDVTLNNTYLT